MVAAGVDSFCAHLTASVKEVLWRWKVDVAIIPGGLTPVLQPLDKCLNKPFKDNVRQQYLSWLITGPFEFTPARKKKALSQNQVLRWVKQAWCDIPKEMVRRSFRTCGISNALDSTEDDAIFDKNIPEENSEDQEMDDEFETDSEEKDSSKIDPNQTTTKMAPLGATK